MNFETLLLTLLCITNIKPILKEQVTSHWILFLIKSFIKSKSLFKKTKWARKKDDESKFVKSMMLIPVFYLNFKKKFDDEKALEIINEIIIKISFTFDNNTSKKNYLSIIRDPFERWLKYRSTLIAEGFGAYNKIEDVYINRNRMHYIVKRCIFHDFFVETGTPELTPLICDYDQLYHSSIFKEFYFDRNGSWKNTIGHGAEVCHYVWKDKNILTKEFMDFLDNRNKQQDDNDRRKIERRQFDRRQFDRRQFDRRKI